MLTPVGPARQPAGCGLRRRLFGTWPSRAPAAPRAGSATGRHAAWPRAAESAPQLTACRSAGAAESAGPECRGPARAAGQPAELDARGAGTCPPGPALPALRAAGQPAELDARGAGTCPPGPAPSGGAMPARRHCGRVASASRSWFANAARHMARAVPPQPCSSAPPVLLGTETVTQPPRDWPYAPGFATPHAVSPPATATASAPAAAIVSLRRPGGRDRGGVRGRRRGGPAGFAGASCMTASVESGRRQPGGPFLTSAAGCCVPDPDTAFMQLYG